MYNSRYKFYSLYKISSILGPLEEEVFNLIQTKTTVRKILKLINEKSGKNYAYTTIMTVMDNLYQKGFLSRQKIGKSYYYQSVTQLSQLKKISCFFLINQMKKIFGIKNFSYQFLLFLINPFLTILKQPFFIGLTNSFFTFFLFYFLINFISEVYFQGFFEYLFFLFNNPKFLTNLTAINLTYLLETLSFFKYLLISLIIFIFIKKTKIFVISFK